MTTSGDRNPPIPWPFFDAAVLYLEEHESAADPNDEDWLAVVTLATGWLLALRPISLANIRVTDILDTVTPFSIRIVLEKSTTKSTHPAEIHSVHLSGSPLLRALSTLRHHRLTSGAALTDSLFIFHPHRSDRPPSAVITALVKRACVVLRNHPTTSLLLADHSLALPQSLDSSYCGKSLRPGFTSTVMALGYRYLTFNIVTHWSSERYASVYNRPLNDLSAPPSSSAAASHIAAILGQPDILPSAYPSRRPATTTSARLQ